MLKSSIMKKIPHLLRASLAIVAGISLVILGSVITRGGETWQSCTGIILLLIGLPISVSGALLLMREQWVGGIAPGNYYTYTCPHCGGTIHSYQEPILQDIECPYCAKTFPPR